MPDTLDLQDIQGLIIRGYGDLKAACYVLLEISNAFSAKAWLNAVADTVTTGQTRATEKAFNVAFTYTGIQKLGLEAPIAMMFSNEFITGMITSHRSLLLGDLGESAPTQWYWGGPNNKAIDMVFMLFAVDDQQLADIYTAFAKTLAVNGLQEVLKLDTSDIGDKEHFGFRDGISQPVIEGLPDTEIPLNTVKAGEFLLGYPNEYGLYTDRPLLQPELDPRGLLPHDNSGSGNADLGRNGSYLVFRQLRQDVRAFWQRPPKTRMAAVIPTHASSLPRRWWDAGPAVLRS
jgi:deferrochelatase/peroxidase EfeB